MILTSNTMNACLSVLLLLPGMSQAGTVTVSPGYTMPPAPTVFASSTDVDVWVYGGGAGGWDCGALVGVQVQDPNHPDRHRYHYYRHKEPAVQLGVVNGKRMFTCWGYDFRVAWLPEDREYNMGQVKALLRRGIELEDRYATDGELGWWGYERGGCSIQLYINGGANVAFNAGYSNNHTNSCIARSRPRPAECKTVVPGAVEHGTRPTDTGTSRVTDTVEIECDQTTSVDIDIGQSSLPLHEGNQELPSQLYIGRDGQTAARFSANPRVSVPLISIINTDRTKPGKYEGSRVIIVSWD